MIYPTSELSYEGSFLVIRLQVFQWIPFFSMLSKIKKTYCNFMSANILKFILVRRQSYYISYLWGAHSELDKHLNVIPCLPPALRWCVELFWLLFSGHHSAPLSGPSLPRGSGRVSPDLLHLKVGRFLYHSLHLLGFVVTFSQQIANQQIIIIFTKIFSYFFLSF